MANREAKQRNRSNKGETGPLTTKQRKRKGKKARPHVAHKGKGKP